jgi:hypothetical protein
MKLLVITTITTFLVYLPVQTIKVLKVKLSLCLISWTPRQEDFLDSVCRAP